MPEYREQEFEQQQLQIDFTDKNNSIDDGTKQGTLSLIFGIIAFVLCIGVPTICYNAPLKSVFGVFGCGITAIVILSILSFVNAAKRSTKYQIVKQLGFTVFHPSKIKEIFGRIFSTIALLITPFLCACAFVSFAISMLAMPLQNFGIDFENISLAQFQEKMVAFIEAGQESIDNDNANNNETENPNNSNYSDDNSNISDDENIEDTMEKLIENQKNWDKVW